MYKFQIHISKLKSKKIRNINLLIKFFIWNRLIMLIIKRVFISTKQLIKKSKITRYDWTAFKKNSKKLK